MLENPIILAALTCFFLGLALSGLARVVPGSTIASVVLPIIFLASYVVTYQQVPDFPPIGATNKIFYIALAAALVGFALDLLPRPANYRKLLAVIMPLLIVAWIGFPRFAKPDIELIATTLGLWLGGTALLWRLEIVATTPAERNGGGIVGTAMLMALMLAFAPVALLGGSSTSLMLCLATVSGLAAVVLWELILPRDAFGASAIFGVGGGLLAMIDTVTLITRHVDLAALALLLLIPFAGEVGARLLLPLKRFRGRVRQVLVGTLSAVPVSWWWRSYFFAILSLCHKERTMRLPLASVSMIAAFLASATASEAADYTIDPTHSHVLFTIDHLGFAKMVGLFSDFSGNIIFDADNVPASKLNVTIKTDSLQTQFAPRDRDLKGADWFNVTEFPEMTFVGTEFAKKDDHTGMVTGKLTLHGVTKSVTLNVVVNKVGQNPLDKIDSAGFSARGTFKRSDFGMKTYLGAIGDDVDLIIEIEAKKKS